VIHHLAASLAQTRSARPTRILGEPQRATDEHSRALAGPDQAAEADRMLTAPAHVGSASTRHETAVRRSLASAEDDAREGNYASALSWLDTVEAVDGGLPDEFQAHRRTWADRLEP
jgi:hypothetical protein